MKPIRSLVLAAVAAGTLVAAPAASASEAKVMGYNCWINVFAHSATSHCTTSGGTRILHRAELTCHDRYGWLYGPDKYAGEPSHVRCQGGVISTPREWRVRVIDIT